MGCRNVGNKRRLFRGRLTINRGSNGITSYFRTDDRRSGNPVRITHPIYRGQCGAVIDAKRHGHIGNRVPLLIGDRGLDAVRGLTISGRAVRRNNQIIIRYLRRRFIRT